MKKKFPSKFDITLEIHSPKAQKDFVCEYCLKEFQKGERICVLGTYELIDNISYSKVRNNNFIKAGFVSEYFYHIACWKQYFNQAIKDSVEAMQKQLLSNPAIKQAMSLVGGLVKA